MVKRLAVWPAIAALAMLGGGCRKNTASVQAFQICNMPDDCAFSAECDEGFLGAPALDVAGDTAMWLAVEMRNQLADNSDAEAGRVNTHDAHFESYTLEYSGARAALLPASVGEIAATTGYAQQLIPAGGTAVIGFEPFPFGVVDGLLTSGTVPAGPDYDEVTVTVTFKGRYEDGAKWEVPLEVPVRLCQNCISLVCEDPTEVVISACPGLYQLPRGKLTCTAPAPTCVTAGTWCGSNVNMANGEADTLYACGGPGESPSNSQVCANGCDASGTPDNFCTP